MIDAGLSLRAVKGLTGSAFAAYLLQKEWSARPSRVEGISILSKNVSGSSQPVEFILPIAAGFTDEHLRLADALRSVAAVESRSVEAIADDIRQLAGTARPKLHPSSLAPKLAADSDETSIADVSEIEIYDSDDGSLVVIRNKAGDKQILRTPVVKFEKYAKSK